MLRKNKNGFTLVELLVVIVILGVLVLIATPDIKGYTEKAKIAQITSDIANTEAVIGASKINDETYGDDWGTVVNSSVVESDKDSVYKKTGKTSFDNSESYKKIEDKVINTQLEGTFMVDGKGGVLYYDSKNEVATTNSPSLEGKKAYGIDSGSISNKSYSQTIKLPGVSDSSMTITAVDGTGKNVSGTLVSLNGENANVNFNNATVHDKEQTGGALYPTSFEINADVIYSNSDMSKVPLQTVEFGGNPVPSIKDPEFSWYNPYNSEIDIVDTIDFLIENGYKGNMNLNTYNELTTGEEQTVYAIGYSYSGTISRSTPLDTRTYSDVYSYSNITVEYK